MTCLTNNFLNVSQPAVAYSALAGVMAGFAFLALIYVLTDRAKEDGEKLTLAERNEVDRVLIALTCGMFGILFSTLQYAIITGDASPALQHGQTSSEELMANISFATSLLTLMYGVARLIRSSDFIWASRVMRLLASVAIPVSAATFFSGVIVEIAAESWMGSKSSVCGSNAFYAEANSMGSWIVPTAVVSITLGFWLVPFVIPAKYREVPWIWAAKYGNAIPFTSLLAVFVAGAKGIAYNEYIPQEKLTESECWATLSGAVLLLLVQSALIRFSGGKPRPSSEIVPPPLLAANEADNLSGDTSTPCFIDEAPWRRIRRAWFAFRVSDHEPFSHAELTEFLSRQAALFNDQAQMLERQIARIQSAEKLNETGHK
jgi:hypothetical protein